MEQVPFFSIVMPVYGVEKYLAKAVDSILHQTFQDFELILVDDCSLDSSPAICEKYAKQNMRVKVIHHKQNRGVSYARNSGIDAATGAYLWFMDSDDYAEPDLLEQIYHSIQKNPAELVVFGFKEKYYDDRDEFHHQSIVLPDEHLCETKEQVRSQILELENRTLYGYPWNKFYLLSYLKELGLRFEKVSLNEDIFFNVKFCMDIEKMNLLAISPYHYNKRLDNCLTSKFVPDYFKLHHRRIKVIYQQFLYWNICTSQVKSTLAVLYTRYIFSALQRNCDKRSHMSFSEKKNWINKVFHDSLYRELIPYGHARSASLNIMLFILKHKLVFLCLMLGRVIYIVKNKLPMLFSKIKQDR